MNERGARIIALAAAIAAVAAVIVLLVTTYGGDDATTVAARPSTPPVGERPAPAGPPEPSGGPSTGPTRAYEGNDATLPEDAHDPPLDKQARKDVRVATAKFLEAWLTPGTPGQRTRGIGPYATTELTRLLAMTARANVPDAKVKGAPDIVDSSPYTASTVAALTDGERLRCNLILDTSGWRVSEILPDNRDTQTPGPTSSRSSTPPGAR